MDKTYNHKGVEEPIYSMWEKSGFFTPKIDKNKKPLPAGRQAFTIIMPPPNANGSLHIGHAMFLTIEDIMIRYHRMKGDPTLWLPGADHAGILTQVVFERKLEKEEGKTRYDLGREEFFKRCMEFTLKNKKVMETQMKAIGASCDWTKECFTLDPKFNRPIYLTFKKLYQDGLIYRTERMVNWCPRCTTALSDLEVIHKEQKDPLYYIHYGPFVLATVRPETKFGDTAVAVHPKDKRYQKWIGKKIEVEGLLGKFKMKVVADEAVDPEFGTGVVKVTPAHDPVDFEIGQRHNLEIKQVIDFEAKLNEKTGKYKGLKVIEARKKVASDLQKKGLIKKIDNYIHSISICERCKTVIEPMISLQWFIKTKPLAQKAIKAVKKKEIKIIPRRFEKNYFIWMENIRDWCISRQLWWGHQLPVWYCGKKHLSPLQLAMNPNLKKIKDTGCGEIIIDTETPKKCPKCKNTNLIRDPDTLDTWFSSGQWPFTTLGWKQMNQESTDFNYFYPTSVMETGYEILFFWVARMIMLGIYSTGQIPFKTVYLHGLVRDALGEKMSKSKGNVIDPLDVIEKYGADSLRFALVYGAGSGSDIKLGENKIVAMRNFSNKLWNIGRFIKMNMDKNTQCHSEMSARDDNDKKILSGLSDLEKKVTKSIENYRFDQAANSLYEFIWHQFADKYIEASKEKLRENNPTTLSVLLYTYKTCLKLLHPFMPFITEEIYKQLSTKETKPLITSEWPN